MPAGRRPGAGRLRSGRRRRPGRRRRWRTLCGAFGLSPFERLVLLLCRRRRSWTRASRVLCAAAQRRPGPRPPDVRSRPGRAARRRTGRRSRRPGRCGTGGWSSWTGGSPTASPLRVDERVLHFLAGAGELDARLGGLLVPVPEDPDLSPVPRRHRQPPGRAVAPSARPARPGSPAGRSGRIAVKPALAAAAAACWSCACPLLDVRLLPADRGRAGRAGAAAGA